MSLKTQISDDIKEAMRAREQEKLSTLRMLAAAIKQIEVDEQKSVEDDATIIGVLTKLVKQRKESIAQFQLAKRDDLASKEQLEIDILARYLPEPLSDAAIEHAIEEAIATVGAKTMADMGKVMAILKSKLHGQADMSKVSAILKAKL